MRLLSLSLFFLLFSTAGFAQRRMPVKVKDSLVLSCPLTNAIEQKQAYQMGTDEKKIVIASATDTIVRASTSGKVTTIRRDEEGNYEVVFYHDDYWLWYTGIKKIAVSVKQVLKDGDPIGYIETNQPIEILVYDFETPLDPKKYLKCTIAPAR